MMGTYFKLLWFLLQRCFKFPYVCRINTVLLGLGQYKFPNNLMKRDTSLFLSYEKLGSCHLWQPVAEPYCHSLMGRACSISPYICSKWEQLTEMVWKFKLFSPRFLFGHRNRIKLRQLSPPKLKKKKKKVPDKQCASLK